MVREQHDLNKGHRHPCFHRENMPPHAGARLGYSPPLLVASKVVALLCTCTCIMRLHICHLGLHASTWMKKSRLELGKRWVLGERKSYLCNLMIEPCCICLVMLATTLFSPIFFCWFSFLLSPPPAWEIPAPFSSLE